MTSIVIYTTKTCPYCIRAKALLDAKGQAYTEIAIDGDPALREQMTRQSGRQTVPQIFINNLPIGGCDELYALERQGKLDPLINLQEE